MAISEYYAAIRSRIGNDLLLIPSVAAVVHDDLGRVLIQERREGGFSLPAGAIEPGETPFDAAMREVREETGLVVAPETILGAFGGKAYRTAYPNGDEVEYTVILVRCEVVGGSLAFDDETKGASFFQLDEIPSLTMEYPRHRLAAG